MLPHYAPEGNTMTTINTELNNIAAIIEANSQYLDAYVEDTHDTTKFIVEINNAMYERLTDNRGNELALYVLAEDISQSIEAYLEENEVSPEAETVLNDVSEDLYDAIVNLRENAA